MPRAVLWHRTDTAGAEHVLLDDRRGLSARGVQVAVDPVPYTCRYELQTDPTWATVRLQAEAEGAGWLRSVRLERTGDRWRVVASEQGDLDAALRAAGVRATAPLPGAEDPSELDDALDVDLAGSPLTNTLPLRRHGMLDITITAAWVLLPSLAVVPARQSYQVLGPDRVRYTSGTFSADLDLDADRYVTRYPGLAERG